MILTGRGNELSRETFTKIFTSDDSYSGRDIRVLLPATEKIGDEKDWTDQREKELSVFDISYKNEGILKKQIETNINFLKYHKEEEILDFGRFNIPHIGRIVLTERALYYTPYSATEHGRDSKVFKFRRSGAFYDNFERLFE